MWRRRRETLLLLLLRGEGGGRVVWRGLVLDERWLRGESEKRLNVHKQKRKGKERG